MSERFISHEQHRYSTDVEGLSYVVDRLKITYPEYETELPILFSGNDNDNPKNLILLIPGIGAATYKKGDTIYSYFSKATKKLLEKDPSLLIATIANWPNYQEKDPLVGCKINTNGIDANSIDTKNKLIKSTLEFLINSINPEKTTMIAHSTGSNSIIRNYDNFEKLPDLKIVTEAPSGIAKRSETLIMSEELAKNKLLSSIATVQKWVLNPFIPMIAKSYGITYQDFKNDSYLPGSFVAINTKTLQNEINSEAKLREINFIINENISVMVGENDPMVNVKDLESRSQTFEVISGAGHLLHRQDRFLDTWAEQILTAINK